MNCSTWNDLYEIIDRPDAPSCVGLWGVPRGGTHIAQMLADARQCWLVDTPEEAGVIVDDLIDSGRTQRTWSERCPETPFWAAIDKRKMSNPKWITFPWEVNDEVTGAEDAAVRLLQALDAPIHDEGMLETPDRMVRSLRELTQGYAESPGKILSKRFPVGYDEMIVVRGIEFWSLCEHHLLPFHGTATVGYIPGTGGVVGLSKLARLVHCFSRRFQIQERLTAQIADAMDEHLAPLGVGVVVHATHLCMAMRGVRTPADMVTSDLRGVMREPTPRGEFLALERSG